MIPEPGILSADEAIEKAFEYFEKYVERGQRLSHVLLEELEYIGEGDGWRVVVGFDIGRTKKTNASAVLFGEEKNEPIREFRSFIISEIDGSLIKLT